MKIDGIWNILIFVFILLFLGCDNYSDQTKKLNTILLRYDESISKNHHLYIIQSKFNCGGCIQSIYRQLETTLISSDKVSITIIAVDKKNIPNHLLSKVTFINDTLRLTNREFKNYFNLTIFETFKGKIVKYKNLNDSKKIDLPKFVSDFITNNSKRKTNNIHIR